MMSPVDKDEVHRILLVERFEYHRHLTHRRWQIFGAFLLINALLINAWDKIWSIKQQEPMVFLLLFVVALITGIVVLRLLSYTRDRIYENAAALNSLAGEEIVMLPALGRMRIDSTTPLLYFGVIALSLFWFVGLFAASRWLFSLMTALYLAALCSLTWRVKAQGAR